MAYSVTVYICYFFSYIVYTHKSSVYSHIYVVYDHLEKIRATAHFIDKQACSYIG